MSLFLCDVLIVTDQVEQQNTSNMEQESRLTEQQQQQQTQQINQSTNETTAASTSTATSTGQTASNQQQTGN